MVRRLLLATALAATLTVTACGDKDIDKLRNEAEQVQRDAKKTIDDIRSGATADDVRRELDKVKKELDKSDLPEEARQKLEDAKAELERAKHDLEK
jgi:Tfp pilus assembly protein PilP